jgi:tetratricopeptide (TPR) repeat protein
VIAAALALALLAATAAATPQQKLDDARQRFRDGDYKSAIAIVYPLLFPNPALSTEAQILDAYVILGVCYFETDDLAEAEKWFEEALLIDPALELSPDVYSSKAVDFFRKLKKAIKDKLDQAEKDRQMKEYRDALSKLRQVEKVTTPYWINFVPFGAGQFANGQGGKGKFFAITEAATGAVSVGAFLILSIDYGWPRHQIPNTPEDLDFAANLQRVQVGAGVAFVVLYGWGVVDALLEHKPQVIRETKIDPKDLPKDLRPPQSGLRLLPAVGPDGGGALLTWEF